MTSVAGLLCARRASLSLDSFSLSLATSWLRFRCVPGGGLSRASLSSSTFWLRFRCVASLWSSCFSSSLSVWGIRFLWDISRALALCHMVRLPLTTLGYGSAVCHLWFYNAFCPFVRFMSSSCSWLFFDLTSEAAFGFVFTSA